MRLYYAYNIYTGQGTDGIFPIGYHLVQAHHYLRLSLSQHLPYSLNRRKKRYHLFLPLPIPYLKRMHARQARWPTETKSRHGEGNGGDDMDKEATAAQARSLPKPTMDAAPGPAKDVTDEGAVNARLQLSSRILSLHPREGAMVARLWTRRTQNNRQAVRAKFSRAI